jgi:hypothetical protein
MEGKGQRRLRRKAKEQREGKRAEEEEGEKTR